MTGQRTSMKSSAHGINARLLIAILGVLAVGLSSRRTAAALAHPPPAAAPAPMAHEPAAVTSDNEAAEEPHAVVPPGQEELLADMLGRGATLAQGCTFAAGQADGRVIHATYACPSGHVVFVLHHPGQSPSALAETERFAITLQSGTPPNGLVDDLTSRIRSRERPFEWLWIGERSPRSSPGMVLLFAAGLIGLVALVWVRRARKSARRL
jgi:hypothetical protein